MLAMGRALYIALFVLVVGLRSLSLSRIYILEKAFAFCLCEEFLLAYRLSLLLAYLCYQY